MNAYVIQGMGVTRGVAIVIWTDVIPYEFRDGRNAIGTVEVASDCADANNYKCTLSKYIKKMKSLNYVSHLTNIKRSLKWDEVTPSGEYRTVEVCN